MTTTTIVPDNDPDVIRLDDLEALDTLAFNIAVHVRRRCGLTMRTWFVHLEDMKQEVLLQCVAHAGKPRPYVIQAAIYTLIEYVLVSIRNLQGGWYFSAGDISGYHTGYIEEMGPAGASDFNPYSRLLFDGDLRYGVPRPVERDVLRREGADEEEALWRDVEREILDVLVGMKAGQWHPEALVTAAAVLARSARGMSHHAIGAVLGLDGNQVREIRAHYREALADYLACGPLTQGVIQAHGHSAYVPFADLTEAQINSDGKLLVAFPHGIFPLAATLKRRNGKEYLRFQAGRRVNGKVVNRSVQVGAVGTVTKQDVWDGSLRFLAKLRKLEERQAQYG